MHPNTSFRYTPVVIIKNLFSPFTLTLLHLIINGAEILDKTLRTVSPFKYIPPNASLVDDLSDLTS